MGFEIALTNVAIALLYLLPGFVLQKAKRLRAEHLSGLSSLLVFVCAPCMIISSFMQLEYSGEVFANMGLFFGVTFVLQAVFIFIIYLLTKRIKFKAKNKKSEPIAQLNGVLSEQNGENSCEQKGENLEQAKSKNKNAIIAIASISGNVGFFGLPLIKALFPNNPEVACYSCTFTLSMNILMYTVGIFILTGDKKYVSLKKALINPATIGMIIALPLFIFGLGKYLPQALTDCAQMLGKLTTPLCMIILGARLATMSFKNVFLSKTAYLVCLVKLIIFPLICYACVYFLPIAYTFKASILILSATPCASMVLNLAEIYKAQPQNAANSALLSNLLCILTLPLITLLV